MALKQKAEKNIQTTSNMNILSPSFLIFPIWYVLFLKLYCVPSTYTLFYWTGFSTI